MRPYKFVDTWIDLDHVLAIYPPEETYYPGRKFMVVPVLMAFQNRPLDLYMPVGGEDYEPPNQFLRDRAAEAQAALVAAWAAGK